MTKMRIGLIGFGAWVQSAYLPALQYDGRAEVAAVAAPSERTRQRARETLGGQVALYSGYQELLQQAQVDAVMVAVPDFTHQEVLSAVLDTGLPVFYEPPVSHLRAQIPVMLRRLLAAPQPTFAHLELGFHPAVHRAAELVRSHAIGPLQSVSITLHAGWGCTENSDLCLIDRMSAWYVDVLNRITDSVPDRVLLLDGRGGTERMQSVSTGIYDYQGVWGVFRADVGRPGELAIVIEATGKTGSIEIDYFTGELTCRTAGSSKLVREDCPPARPYADYPAVRETVSAFLDAASGNGEGNARSVAQLNEIGLAAERSKDTGTWADVKKQG